MRQYITGFLQGCGAFGSVVGVLGTVGGWMADPLYALLTWLAACVLLLGLTGHTLMAKEAEKA